jgi:epoxide hydrolase-like predicted phosphatase
VSIRAIVFDWGGVLMRTIDYGPRHHWDDQLGLPHGSVEQAVHGLAAWRQAQLGEISLDMYWHAVGDHLGLTTEQTARLRVDFYSGDKLNNSLCSSIRRWQQKSLKMGLLSNNTLDLAQTLKDNHVDTLFDAIVISAGIRVMKPETRAYTTMLDRLKVAPAEAVMVDDFPANIDGARAVGMAGVMFTPDGSWHHDLEKLIESSR